MLPIMGGRDNRLEWDDEVNLYRLLGNIFSSIEGGFYRNTTSYIFFVLIGKINILNLIKNIFRMKLLN